MAKEAKEGRYSTMMTGEQMQKIEEIQKKAEEVTVAAVQILYETFKSADADSRKWILEYLTKVDKELREQGR